MLKEKNFFKFFWIIMLYFGLQYYKQNIYEKFRSISYFVILVGLSLVLYFMALILNDDVETRINGLQTFPFFVQMMMDGFNFAAKTRKMEELFIKIDQVYEKIDDGDKFFKTGYSQFNRFLVISGFLGFSATLGGILLFLLTGSTPVLIYTPYKHGFRFFILWVFQTAFFLYSALLNYLLDTFMNALLMILSSYIKAVRNHVRMRKITDLQEIIEIHVEMKL